MAQNMAATLPHRSNAPASVFAEETKKVTKKAPVMTEQPEDEQIAQLEENMANGAGEEQAPETDLEKMIAARKALDDQIRAAKASSKPTRSNLEVVRARYAHSPKWLGTWMGDRVAKRVAAGQSQDAAVDEELRAVREALQAQIAQQ
jgi:hypothetical protein